MLPADTAYSQTSYKFDAATVSGLPARNIGSATMSGRIAAVDAVEEDGRITVFVGSASGGVWKSVNGGTTFKPVFDRESVQSIGAVAIDPSNPKTVWVGTGETWMRNSVSIGDGVYKSTDGGENWTNVGLKDSEHIAKILVDPERRQHRPGLRHRTSVGRQRRARRLQDHRRRQDLEQGSGRRECLHRMRHAGHEPPGTEDDLRVDVGLPAPGLDLPLRRRRAADCSSPPTAASTGPKSPTATPRACRQNPTDASRSPSRLRSRRWSTP